MKLFYVGETSELRYNKTRVMDEAFRLMPIDYRFIDICATHPNRLIRAWELLTAYRRLCLEIGPCPEGGIIWLSEFKFSAWHALLAKLVCRIRGLTLIGGPHTLSADRLILIDPAFQSFPLSRARRVKLWYLRLRDSFVVSQLDVLQSYTLQYLDRIRQLTSSHGKRGVIFPIGAPRELANQAKELEISCTRRSPRVDRPLRIVFWGVPTILHGLDVLLQATRMVIDRGANLQVDIYAPRNATLAKVMQLVDDLGLAKVVHIDHETSVSKNFAMVVDADLAVSHLVSANLAPEAFAVVNAISTNKLAEILVLGVPLLIARTDGVADALPDGCISVAPGDQQSVADAIWNLVKERSSGMVSTGPASSGSDAFLTDAIAQRVYGEISLLGPVVPPRNVG